MGVLNAEYLKDMGRQRDFSRGLPAEIFCTAFNLASMFTKEAPTAGICYFYVCGNKSVAVSHDDREPNMAQRMLKRNFGKRPS